MPALERVCPWCREGSPICRAQLRHPLSYPPNKVSGQYLPVLNVPPCPSIWNPPILGPPIYRTTKPGLSHALSLAGAATHSPFPAALVRVLPGYSCDRVGTGAYGQSVLWRQESGSEPALIVTFLVPFEKIHKPHRAHVNTHYPPAHTHTQKEVGEVG